MPIALDPNQTTEVTVGTATYTCRYLTCRAVLLYEQRLTDAADKNATQFQSNESLNKALMLALTGWNLPMPFSADALDDALTPSEKWELAVALPGKIMASEEDKKKSSS